MMLDWLWKGLAVTGKKLFSRKITQRYPEVYPDLSPRTRSAFQFDKDKCTSCNLCAMACPNRVITVNFNKNEQGKRELQEYQMSMSYCLFCGMCVEACPTSAIQMCARFTPAFKDKTISLTRWKGSNL
ncbi:MAG: NADH-quinone oxidoreductase subunit I [Candidatus Margulisiibacteriota bacterium]